MKNRIAKMRQVMVRFQPSSASCASERAMHERTTEPSPACFRAVCLVLGRLVMHGIMPIESVRLDADEGIGIVVGDLATRYVTFLCDDEGAVGVLCAERDGPSEAWDLPSLKLDTEVLREQFSKVRRFLRGEQ